MSLYREDGSLKSLNEVLANAIEPFNLLQYPDHWL